MSNFKKNLFKILNSSITLCCIGFLLGNMNITSAHAGQKDCHENHLNLPKGSCAKEVRKMIRQNHAYTVLFETLNPFIPSLTTLTHNALNSDADYNQLLVLCEQIAALLPTGRVVVCDPDGLVIVDTGKTNNTLANAQAGANPSTFANAINVNHNSRISILDAQEWICGIGVETKFSNSVGVDQQYVAIRLGRVGEKLKNNRGAYLNNEGTARLSVNQGTIQ